MSTAVAAKSRNTRVPAEVLISETEWLLSFGTHPATIASQLRMTLDGLQQVMRRHGKPELLEALHLRQCDS